jgi:UDP-N-acetylmuramoyl-tripeptide--D-alanyl-D-alanine ligase
MSSASVWLLCLGVGAACHFLVWHRLLAYLRYFQQETYDAVRFLKWVHVRSLGDPAFWLAIVTAFVARTAVPGGAAGFMIGAVLLAAVQPDPRRTGKVLLKLTWRATRIVAVSLLYAVALWIALVLASGANGALTVRAALTAAAVLYAVLPLVLIAANASLAPYEKDVQRGYEAEAAQRLAAVHPFIIGITGSYGKSSAKAMLAHLLQFHRPTLAASGSINTLMGLTRHIREELVPGHQFMVVEMGAFKRGSIRRLCQLAPPDAGLITAVGDMHLERFGSTDEIVRAKSELAEALPDGGLLVVNADSPGALRIARGAARHRVLLYGERSDEILETRLEDVQFSKAGTSFTLLTREGARSCFTPLLGRPIILNLTGAYTLAVALGADPELVLAAFRTLKPVANRLEVVDEGGITWIRDAYNSNQFGFRAALEVAAALPAVRRFLVTPGVIELGPEQVNVNRALAREAAAVCDTTLIVADTNREAFVEGFRAAGSEARLVSVAGRAEAFTWLREHAKQGDLIVLENDLPDLYERAAGLFWPGGAGRK